MKSNSSHVFELTILCLLFVAVLAAGYAFHGANDLRQVIFNGVMLLVAVAVFLLWADGCSKL